MEHPEETRLYEDKPIAFGIIWKAVVVLVLVAAFIHVVIWAEFRELDNYKKQMDPRVSPLQPKQHRKAQQSWGSWPDQLCQLCSPLATLNV